MSSDLGHLFILDLFRSIRRAMIVFVSAIEEKDGRNALLRKIVVIRTIVESVGILFVIVGIVKGQLFVTLVDRFVDLMKVSAQAIRTYYIDIVRVVSVFFINPSLQVLINNSIRSLFLANAKTNLIILFLYT